MSKPEPTVALNIRISLEERELIDELVPQARLKWGIHQTAMVRLALREGLEIVRKRLEKKGS